MGVGGRIVAGCALLVASFGPQAGTTQPPDSSSDIQFIVAEAQKVQEADVAAWTRYRFERRAEREDYDEAGHVLNRDDLDFLVTPDADGFREDLLRHNGTDASRSEKDEQRRSGSFAKHYRTLVAGDDGGRREGYSVGQLLHLSSYRFAGQEMLNGVACYRLDFTPDDVDPRSDGMASRFTRAMQGSVWITAEGFHLAAARAETVRPITIVLALSKVYSLAVRMDAGPVGDGVWLPSRVEVETHARLVIRTIRRRNLFSYSDYSRIGRRE